MSECVWGVCVCVCVVGVWGRGYECESECVNRFMIHYNFINQCIGLPGLNIGLLVERNSELDTFGFFYIFQ